MSEELELLKRWLSQKFVCCGCENRSCLYCQLHDETREFLKNEDQHQPEPPRVLLGKE